MVPKGRGKGKAGKAGKGPKGKGPTEGTPKGAPQGDGDPEADEVQDAEEAAPPGGGPPAEADDEGDLYEEDDQAAADEAALAGAIDPAEMMRIMARSQVRSERLMRSVQQGGGTRTGGPSSSRSTYIKPTAPPKFTGAGWERYRKALKEWENTMWAANLDESQFAPLLFTSLSGEALNQARTVVSPENLASW